MTLQYLYLKIMTAQVSFYIGYMESGYINSKE